MEKNNELFALLIEKKKKALELVEVLGKANNLNEDLKLINDTIYQLIMKVPKYLNNIERLVYYFHIKEKLTLQEIADGLNLTHQYVLKINMRLNKKLNKRKKIDKVLTK